MKKRLRIRLVALLIFATAQGAAAQGVGDRNSASSDGRDAVYLKLFLPDGRSAVGFQVKLESQDFKEFSGQTDGNGTFRFGGLSPGNYRVVVRGGEKYDDLGESVIIDRKTLGGAQTQTVNLILHLRAKRNLQASSPTVVPAILAGVPASALEKYNQAAKAASEKDAKEAISLLKKAIAIYPNFAAAYNEMGLLRLSLKEYDEAMTCFKLAVKIVPEYFEPKLNYGIALYSKKDFAAAENILMKVLDERKDVPKAHLYLGMAWLRLGKLDQAEAALKYAISLKGGQDIALAHRYLGGIYLQKGLNSEAIAELQKYIDLAPKAPDIDKIKKTVEEHRKKISGK